MKKRENEKESNEKDVERINAIFPSLSDFLAELTGKSMFSMHAENNSRITGLP